MEELAVEKHTHYILSIEKRKDDFESLVMEHLRLNGAYWGLTTLDLMHKLDSVNSDEAVSWILSCQDSDSGGFGGNIGYDPHLLYTLSAVQVLALLDRLDALDMDKVSDFFKRKMDHLLEIYGVKLTLVSCKNLDGGFGCVPGGESHAGQIFCCVGALAIAGSLHHVDRDLLGWWLCERQCKDGGLNGRPEKLTDVCYSWWVLSSLLMIDRVHCIDKDKLSKFILNCQDIEKGGISDRPDNAVDVFHTYFWVAGLSLMECPGLKAIDPAWILLINLTSL